MRRDWQIVHITEGILLFGVGCALLCNLMAWASIPSCGSGKHHPSGGGNPVAYSLEDRDTLGLNGL